MTLALNCRKKGEDFKFLYFVRFPPFSQAYEKIKKRANDGNDDTKKKVNDGIGKNDDESSDNGKTDVSSATMSTSSAEWSNDDTKCQRIAVSDQLYAVVAGLRAGFDTSP